MPESGGRRKFLFRRFDREANSAGWVREDTTFTLTVSEEIEEGLDRRVQEKGGRGMDAHAGRGIGKGLYFYRDGCLL